MSTYNYYTEHFEGSYCNDDSLNIKHVTAGAFEEDNSKFLNITDFVSKVATTEYSSQILQAVLSHFSWSFETGKNHRNELAILLKYFVLANHYKLLVPQDIAKQKLAAIQKDYENIRERYPDHCIATEALNNKAKAKHVVPPLVGSTGIMVFATEDYTWIAEETLLQNQNAPEYLFMLTERNKEWKYETIFIGTQKECVKSIMELQKEKYGFNLEAVANMNNENAYLYKTLKELELVLQVPIHETYGYEEEQKKKLEEEAVLQEETAKQIERMRKGLVDSLNVL